MTYTLIGVVTASAIAFTLVTIWQCSPIAAFWDKSILKSNPSSHCFDSEAFWFSYALINIFLDILILFLPIHEVVKLQLPLREKLELIGVFSLGILYVVPQDLTVLRSPQLTTRSVCATSIIRTTTLYSSSRSTDTSWGYIPATVWSVVEANTGTICACLPMLKQPLAHLFPALFRSAAHSSLGDNQGHYPLAARNKNNRPANFAGGRLNSTDYHQWATSDGTVLSPKKHSQFGHRESEERFVGYVPGGKIARTTDVDVAYGSGDSDSLPSLKNHIFAG